MERLSQQQVDYADYRAQFERPEFDIVDGMVAAASDTVRSWTSAKLARGITNIFDDSGEIDPMEANRQFKLEGEAAFKEGEKVTIEQAEKVAADESKVRINALIQNVVNDESPFIGRATQFMTSMAVGMADPVTLAVNVGGSVAIGKAVQRLASNKKAFDAIANASPAAAKFVQSAYSDAMFKGLSTVVAREGIENVATSVVEEALTFNVGNETLSRDITWQDSLTNVIAGSVIGTGLGTVLDKSARQAIGRKLGRQYGEDSGRFITTQLQVSELELKAGVEKSNFEAVLDDFDSFTPRPWHDAKYEYTKRDIQAGDKLYVPVKEDGSIYIMSGRSNGTVFTDNVNFAYNKGVMVKEVDTSGMRLLKESDFISEGTNTPLARRWFNKALDAIIDETDKKASWDKLAKSYAVMKDPDVDLSKVTGAGKKKIKEELLTELEGKNLDEALYFIDSLVEKSGLDHDAEKIFQDMLKGDSYDGYQVSGKNKLGKEAHNGLFVFDSAANKLKTVQDRMAPMASEGDKIKWKLQEEQMLKGYADWAVSRSSNVKDTSPNKVEPVEGHAPNPDMPAKDAVYMDKATKDIVDEVKAELETKAKENPEVVDEDDAKLLKLLNEIESTKELDIRDKGMKAIMEYTKCMRG